MTFSLNESDPVTHLLCNFHQLSFAQSRDIAKKYIFWVSRVIRQTRGIVKKIGIFFKISTGYALNMWLKAFANLCVKFENGPVNCIKVMAYYHFKSTSYFCTVMDHGTGH